uniref:Putative extracellular protein CSOL_058 n=1 Tax=Pseudococcomyxa simplex TaxID=464287 RepID=A0A7L9QE62_9CHLO|nr:putative extracellular protein CSOL_058 [Pseudococcomyxa simplex]
MSRSALTLAIACLVVVSHAAELDRITTRNLRDLRWQPSRTVKEHGRRLQQSVAGSSFANANNITSTIVNATRDGGFLVTGSLLLNAVSPSQVTIQVPQALTGFNTVLNASSLTTTPVAAGAGCAYIAFASSAPVDAFMSTYDDFVSLVTDRGSYDISQKKPIAGSAFTAASKGNATVRLDSADYYVMVIANTAASGSADVLYQFATYSANSTVCRTAGTQVSVNAAGQATTSTLPPSPAPAPKSNITGTTPFFFDFARLADGDIELVTVMTNAACVRYQLLGQLKSTSYADLDLAAFITDTNRTLQWAAAGFNSTLQYAIPGSICAQNTTRQSICEAGLAELKPGERYFLWVASGLQNPDKTANTADAPLRYSARSSGNCLDYTFPRQPRTNQTTTPAAQAPKR